VRLLSVIFAVAVSSGACDAKPVACRDEAGHDTAAIYVSDCMLYSLATHPPCNDANPCWMIVKEVVRSCDLPLPGAPDPKLCTQYKDLQKRYPPQAG